MHVCRSISVASLRRLPCMGSRALASSSSSSSSGSSSSRSSMPLGFVGLGHMGSKMVKNLASDGHRLHVFDRTEASARALADADDKKAVSVAGSVEDVGASCGTVLSMLPNDAVVRDVATRLLVSAKAADPKRRLLHISCSTISPAAARALAKQYAEAGCAFVSSPVFARPDGIQRKQAIWMQAGEEQGRKEAARLLSSSGRVVDFGDDAGASNVVKLCGNFLIAASIESIGEAMALAEKSGVDRQRVMQLLSSSIFDCLIYKGYGQRVSERDHRPGGFSLELGLKDVSLVSQAARDSDVPMPVLSVLLDRFVSARARGRGDLDWSAAGLGAAEDAGIDVGTDLQRNKEAVEKGQTY